jgi:hypothetical protein
MYNEAPHSPRSPTSAEDEGGTEGRTDDAYLDSSSYLGEFLPSLAGGGSDILDPTRIRNLMASLPASRRACPQWTKR